MGKLINVIRDKYSIIPNEVFGINALTIEAEDCYALYSRCRTVGSFLYRD